MFNFLRKKSEVQILKERYNALLHESYKLSKVNRIESDKKVMEAQELWSQIEKLEAKEKTAA